MRRTTTELMAAAALTLALTACGGSETPAPTPTPSPTSSTVWPERAAAIEECTAAVAARPSDENGTIPFEPWPTECIALTDEQYLDAYYDGLQNSNQAGRDALQDAIDDAASKAAETP